ncbi:hypothetical protein [Rhodopirellula sallentina]|uniref:DUF2892 domain-containing protein n=1 Tax=Rhodopirellula sallentina SM41 TaxID=1263870 RepID=M5U7A6_9BACT|nr:hypothetical protein [Rhodopirellula sallentina]EMI57164.1 hypothetical protein RSSM_01392 [Rhodopirellula sallentina SM41]
MLPATNQRVENHTADSINREIAEQTRRRIQYYASRSTDEISHRINELDHEWDVERALECNASALAFSGVVLSATGDKRWLLLPGIVTGFLFQHALQGWCPPLPILRRLGFRTAAEINEERYALKALRGDFDREFSSAKVSTSPASALASASQ